MTRQSRAGQAVLLLVFVASVLAGGWADAQVMRVVATARYMGKTVVGVQVDGHPPKILPATPSGPPPVSRPSAGVNVLPNVPAYTWWR